jgi:hypothetical protein
MILSPASLKLVGLFIGLKQWMRHSSVQTTQNYADLLNSDVGEQVGKVLM